MDLLKYCYFIIIVGSCVKQVTGQIPPGPALTISTSACHGISAVETRVNATCNTGRVIAINDITVGAKPTDSGCPSYWNSSFSYDCCTNKAGDCTFPFYENKQYHELCNGDEQCEFTTQFQQITGECNTINDTYGAEGLSNYMYMDFYCVPDDHIVDMCTAASTSAESDTVYVWNRDFSTTAITTTDTSCECSVEIDNCESDIEVYKIYRQLIGDSDDSCEQNITVYDADSDSVLSWNCDDNDLNFNIETVAKTYITIVLDNQVNTTGGKFWFGFRASLSSNITVNCPAKPQENCIISTTTVQTTTTTVDPTTTTTTDPTSTTTSDPTSTTTSDPTTTTDLTTTTEQTTTTNSTTTTDSPSTTTTTVEVSTTLTEVTTTTTDTITTTTTTEDPITDHQTGDSKSGADDQGDILLIPVILLAALCLILIIVVVTLCILLCKKRNRANTIDVENPPNDTPKPEVARTDYKNSKPPLTTKLPASSSPRGKVVPNGIIKRKTTDSGCQTDKPNAKYQTEPPMTQMSSASCQTDPINLTNTTKTKTAECQTNFDTLNIQMEDKDTMTEINSVDMAVQTDKRSKHKRSSMKVTNNKVHVYPQDDVEITNALLLQTTNEDTVEDVVELDDTVRPMTEDHILAEQPKKRKKKKKKHEKTHDDNKELDLTVQEVEHMPEDEHAYMTEGHESTEVAPSDERFLVPGRKTPTPRELSEDNDSDIEPSRSNRTLNETEKRFLKHRRVMEHAFYSPEIAHEKLEKSLRKSERKKHKKKRYHRNSESKLE